jgi:hypothetical protein
MISSSNKFWSVKMKIIEFRKLIDEYIRIHDTLFSLGNYYATHPAKTREELEKFDQLFVKFQKLGPLIHLEYNKRRTFAKTVQVCRATFHMKGAEDFMEEYEILHRKYLQNKRRMTRLERSRHHQLCAKILMIRDDR